MRHPWSLVCVDAGRAKNSAPWRAGNGVIFAILTLVPLGPSSTPARADGPPAAFWSHIGCDAMLVGRRPSPGVPFAKKWGPLARSQNWGPLFRCLANAVPSPYRTPGAYIYRRGPDHGTRSPPSPSPFVRAPACLSFSPTTCTRRPATSARAHHPAPHARAHPGRDHRGARARRGAPAAPGPDRRFGSGGRGQGPRRVGMDVGMGRGWLGKVAITGGLGARFDSLHVRHAAKSSLDGSQASPEIAGAGQIPSPGNPRALISPDRPA